jgi:DNA repair/transcription protein MET18/MMS19
MCFAADDARQRVRVAALRYLGLIPAVVPYSVIHPHRALVLKELLKVLDDPKKAARKEAVDARSTW